MVAGTRRRPLRRLRFPRVARPAVSVLMPTYGGWEWTRKALEALLSNTEPCYELIVVDNASPDGLGDRLEREVEGATVVRNARNVGFGPANDQAASLARGRALLFLNSDAFVHPGWLPPLLAALDGDPTLGAVGPRILNEDGTLQEAGCLLFRNGYTGFLGLGDDAASPSYLFPRDVDYTSAACLLVRRMAFFDVGGFDPIFAPGYFEDVDLCLALARDGFRIRFEPRSVVTHRRGASSSPELATDFWARNHPVFFDRWKERLESQPRFTPQEAQDPRLVAASRDASALARLLVASGPQAAPSGSELLPDLLGALLGRWPRLRITLLPAAPLETALAELVVAAGTELGPASGDAGAFLTARRFHYDAALFVGWHAFEAAGESVRETQPQATVVLDVPDLRFRHVRDEALPGPPRAAIDALRRREIQALTEADAVVLGDGEDASFARSLAPGLPVVQAPDTASASTHRQGQPTAGILADLLVRLGVLPPTTAPLAPPPS